MSGNISVQFLGGAGYLIRYDGRVALLDAYLTDSCREKGTDRFKRLIPPPINPNDLHPDLILSSHEHGDHFDVGCVPRWMNDNKKALLLGPVSVQKAAADQKIEASRVVCIRESETVPIAGLSVRATYCNHGDDSPEAVGLLIDVFDKRLFFVGDCRYTDDWYKLVGDLGEVDFMMVPINGAYGNPDAVQAAKMVKAVRPTIASPCHYWLFKEHGGDPAEFEKSCEDMGIASLIKFLAVGESLQLSTQI